MKFSRTTAFGSGFARPTLVVGVAPIWTRSFLRLVLLLLLVCPLRPPGAETPSPTCDNFSPHLHLLWVHCGAVVAALGYHKRGS